MNSFAVFAENNLKLRSDFKNKLNQNKIYLWNGSWQTDQMEKICPFIQEWSVKQLRISYNAKPTILKDIVHIKFPHLTLLNIGGNSIVSIEGLSRMSFPSLKELFTWKNNIINLDDLKKAHWPFLKKISFTENMLLQGENLTKMKGICLSQIYIEMSHGEKKQIEDMRWIAKLQTNSINQFRIYSTLRIKQNHLKKVIGKKVRGNVF